MRVSGKVTETVDRDMLEAILDSVTEPILFADTSHTIRYMNKAAVAHYEEGEGWLGKSLLECHNQGSQELMTEILEAMKGGESERIIADGKERRIYMRAVRGVDGRLIGYYERYERQPAELP